MSAADHTGRPASGPPVATRQGTPVRTGPGPAGNAVPEPAGGAAPSVVCRRALLAAGGAAAALCAAGCATTYDPGPAATRGGPAGAGSTGASGRLGPPGTSGSGGTSGTGATSGTSGGSGTTGAAETTGSAAGTTGSSASGGPAQPTAPSAANVLGPSTAVPVGGGIVYTKRQVVVTQPTEGDFRAFSAICTHARCLVSEVTDGAIYCPCHGSTFSISNGAALKGPATKALTPVQVSEDDGNLRLA